MGFRFRGWAIRIGRLQSAQRKQRWILARRIWVSATRVEGSHDCPSTTLVGNEEFYSKMNWQFLYTEGASQNRKVVNILQILSPSKLDDMAPSNSVKT